MAEFLSDETRAELRAGAEIWSDPATLQKVRADVLVALLDENDHFRRENAELDAHAEYMSRELPHVQNNVDVLRMRATSAEAAVDRVRELADELASAPKVGATGEEQWQLDTERRIGRELLATLSGDA